jgi:hypothetical protein
MIVGVYYPLEDARSLDRMGRYDPVADGWSSGWVKAALDLSYSEGPLCDCLKRQLCFGLPIQMTLLVLLL